MEDNFNIQDYLAGGVELILKDAFRASLKNPKESLFLVKFSKYAKKATKIRQKYSENGKNIPVFLIASITSSCNLHCTGCYSRVVLAGGEPMIREDVIVKASEFPEILFPIFTNGTMLNDEYLKLFDDNRNLVPILSIEGDERITDSRRGAGVYKQLVDSMELMRMNNVIFGASLTFTKGNISSLVSREFIDKLHDFGCKVVFFIEYVPVKEETVGLAPGDDERDLLLNEITKLRREYSDMLFLSFPGDEKTSGGCLAAGRGFFHINSHGGAEPCPASPYSDMNVRNASLLEVLESKLFKSLRDEGILMDEHQSGCVLFENKEKVEKLLNDG